MTEDNDNSSKVYSREEALTESIKYFNGDKLAAEVWLSKYALKDSSGNIYEKSPTDMHNRIASELARIESKYANPLSREEILNVLEGFKYIIPAGSPMSGIGNNFQTVSLSNCFVVGVIGDGDSYGGIMKIDQEQVQLMKRRGGVGHDLGHIRPNESPVKNSAITSTGVVPFMERYSNSTREVAQGGRRGALMLSTPIEHPDSEAFIDAKMESGKVTGANISVKISDAFMESVLGDGTFIQHWPIGSTTPSVTKTINSKKLWNKIIFNAWKSAEPGVLFWDQIIRESLPDCYADLGYKTVSTNPCIIGSTLIATADGRNAVSIEQLAKEGNDVPVYSTNPSTGKIEIKYGRNPRKTGINKEVWKLLLDDGSHLIATPDHKILTKDLRYVELKDLKEGDSISPFYSFNSNKYRQISNIGAKMKGGRFANVRQYQMIYRFHNGDIDSKVYAIHHSDYNSKNDSPDNLVKMLHEDHRHFHSELMKGSNNPYHKMSSESKFKFASHPGESNGAYSGITNEVLLDHGRKLFESKGELTKRLWAIYAKENGLPQYVANEFRFGTFSNFKNQVCTNHKVKSVEFYGHEDVYNITVDDNHNYNVITSGDNGYITSSGITVKNCGEIPLCPDDSCRLISINLYSYVDNPFTTIASFNYELFKKHSRIALRIMDDIVDLEIEKIEAIIEKIKSDPQSESIKRTELELWQRIKKKAQDGRRTGVGVTAEGDMLAALGLTYGTVDATKVATEVHKTYAIEVLRESCELAKERGVFAIWDPAREKENPFLLRVKDADLALYNDLMKYGRRNIALLTIAPTGTLSLMTQTTSGVEPAFNVVYRRRRKINPSDKNARVDFVDEVGDSWEEYLVFHPKFIVWLDVNGYNLEEVKGYTDDKLSKLIETSPYHKALANDVDWVEKVRMQGNIQKWIDHSISVTVNLPEHASVDLVNSVYITAWKEGCKGCTIYRDGSRSGVLITKDQKKSQDFKESFPPKRPDVLDCNVVQFNNSKDRWIGFIGLCEGKPYEIFTGKLENFPTPVYVEVGRIVKTKGEDNISNYDFHYTDPRGRDMVIPNLNHAFDEKYHDYAKMISGVLRHGMPVHSVVNLIDSLTLDGDLISTWKAGVKRIFKKFIKDGTKIRGKKCDNCNEGELEYKEGCLSCNACGFSACS